MIFFPNVTTMILTLLVELTHESWAMILVSFESSQPCGIPKRVKSLNSYLNTAETAVFSLQNLIITFQEVDVMTPNGETYSGLAFQKGSCGVSIIRSGEAMEQGLRDCCRSIRIGKILIQVRNVDFKLGPKYSTMVNLGSK